jgi:hypothetical protein
VGYLAIVSVVFTGVDDGGTELLDNGKELIQPWLGSFIIV